MYCSLQYLQIILFNILSCFIISFDFWSIYCRFSDSFDFLVNLPEENHIWCGCSDLMGPLLETFHNYFNDKDADSPLRLLWKRISRELSFCTKCVCQHHQAQESFDVEYQSDSVDPLLKVLHVLDEERVTEHLIEINARIRHKEYAPECHSAEVVCLMFEVCFTYQILVLLSEC